MPWHTAIFIFVARKVTGMRLWSGNGLSPGVFVSIGREACGRCQRFYELVRRGEVRIDTNAFVFVRLNIDEPAQREYFLGTFEPPDSRLPFVGVTDAERSEIRPCLSGAPSVSDYRKLLRTK